MSGSGYRDCACRDCFEIAIGEPHALCLDCADAGCEGDGECERPDAYGCDEDPVCRIALLCQTEGGYPIASLADAPAVVIPRLLAVLRELAPHVTVAPIPADALAEHTHPAWSGGVAEAALGAIVAALNAHAPEGFALILEGHGLGFYPLAGEGV